MTVKIRKVGNSHVITVPKSLNCNDNTTYDVFKGLDGAIVYLPHHKNPFTDKAYTEAHKYDGDNTGFINMENGDEN